MIFHFDIVRIDHDNWRKIGRTLPQLRATYSTIDRLAGDYGWNTSFLCNHDNPRTVSHFGDDSPEWRVTSAKALATLTLTQRATPFLYQGDELGMTNYPFQSIDDFDDVEVKGLWRTLVQTGLVPASCSVICGRPAGTTPAPRCSGTPRPTAASAPAAPGWRSTPITRRSTRRPRWTTGIRCSTTTGG
jgi:glycosidase